MLPAEPEKPHHKAERVREQRGCAWVAQKCTLLKKRRGQERGRRNWPVFLRGARYRVWLTLGFQSHHASSVQLSNKKKNEAL